MRLTTGEKALLRHYIRNWLLLHFVLKYWFNTLTQITMSPAPREHSISSLIQPFRTSENRRKDLNTTGLKFMTLRNTERTTSPNSRITSTQSLRSMATRSPALTKTMAFQNRHLNWVLPGLTTISTTTTITWGSLFHSLLMHMLTRD